MKENFKRRLLAGLLSACMMLQTIGTLPVYAVGNVADSSLPMDTSSVCTHHIHDENCGYTEGTPCTHEHNAECGYKEGTPCTFDTATCESCKAKNTVDADNIVTFAGEEVYAVYDGGSKKFYAATQAAPSTATETVISDKNTINHLYIKGASVPDNLMYEWGNQCIKLKTVICADTVTTIGEEAFKKCTGLESVAMPNVTIIGESTFYGCTSLASIAMPKVEVISTSVFAECTSLTSVAMPSATSIGNQAFSGCKGLTSVVLPEATTIGNEALKNCTSLTSAKLPSAITIDSNAFSDCTSLESVEMPKVTSIGSSAFYGCAKLASVAMPNVTKIGSYAFYDCTGLTSGAMPSAISIGNYAFNGCRRLTSVAMPKVTSIGNQAFFGCTLLASLTIGATPPTVGTNAFAGCSPSRTLTIQGNPAFPGTVLADYKAVADGVIDELWYGWTLPTTLDGAGLSNSAGTLAVSNAITTFGAENTITLTATFDKAAKIGKQRVLAINEVEFKNGTTALGTATATKNADGKWVATLDVNTKDWALGAHKLTAKFAGNHELLGASTTNEVTVTVNESYAVYDGGKFWRTTKEKPSIATAEEITDKKTINNLYIKGESVPASLMLNCTNLKTVICANTVTTIGYAAFGQCTGLTSGAMPNVTKIGNYAFKDCAGLTSVEMTNVTSIGDHAFSSCTSLVSIVTPKVTTIGQYTFHNCVNLTSVAMPEVTTIGQNAFYKCTGLASIEMPKVTSIGNFAFNGCTALTTIELPKVETISEDAFSGCIKLATVSLPEATLINQAAFSNCTELTSANLPNVTSIDAIAFYGCTNLASVEMPKVTSIGTSTFNGCASLTSANLPKVTSIGKYAFKNCTTLASLTLGATPPTVGGNAFTSCPKTNALTIQGNTAFKDTVLADYNTAAGNDDNTTDNKWYGWTLPNSLDSTGVSTSEGKLTAAGSVAVDYGTDNTITFTASFAKVGENKLRTLAENNISLLNGKTVVESKTATLTDGVYSATFTVNTNAFTAGNYNYTATFDGNRSLVSSTATETVTVTINKIDQVALNISGVPSKVTYGDSTFTLTTTGGSGTGDATYTVTAGDAVSVTSAGEVTVLKVGTATITATKASDENYNAKTATAEITVQAATPTLTWGNATQTVTYTGSAAVITAPTATGVAGGTTPNGAISYAYKQAGLLSLFADYTDGLPTDAGEYTIKAKIAADGNYTEAETATALTLTIEKSTPSLAINTMNGKAYDGTAMTNPTEGNMAITGASYADLTFAYSKNSDMGSPLANAPKNAGTYYVQASVVAGDNTNAATSAAVSFTIAKASATGVSQEYPVVKTLAKEYTFDLSKLLPSIASTQEYGNVTYTVGTVGNTDSVLTAVPTNSDIKNGKLALKVANVADKDKKATVSISITTDNFTVANAVITVKTVDKISLTISNVTMAERVYNGSDYAYIGTPTFTNTTDNKAVTGVSFTTEYEGKNSTVYTKSETAPTNAGEYNLILTVSGASAETYEGTLTVPFAITQKQVTVKAKDKDIFAGAEIPSLANPVLDTDYTTDGFIGNDTLTGNVSMAYTGTPDNTKRGSYPITISGTASDNYTVKYETGTLTISIDVSLITAAITSANTAKAGVITSEGKADTVADGTKFVTAAEMKAIDDAITIATSAKVTVANITDAKAAAATLDSAVATFTKAIKTGTKKAVTPPAPTTAPTATPTPAPTTAPTATPTPKATDGGDNTQKPKPTEEKPTAGKTTAAAEVDADGKATVTVPEKSITDAITKAQQTAKKNGTEENGIAVEIEVTSGENINSVSTTLSEESIKELTTAGVKEVTFKSEMGDITIDLETLEQIQKEQGGDIAISVSKTDVSHLDEKLKEEIGDRPVYELNLTKADGTRVTNFDGSITIAIPYTLQEGEDPSNIAVVYINEKGEKEIMSGSGYDEKTQSVIFTTRHFSTFAIVLMPNKIDAPITDIAGADGTTTDLGNANETANTQGGISTGIVVTIVIAGILAIAIVAVGVVAIVKKRRE